VTSENNEQCFSDDQTMDRTNDRSGKPMLTGRGLHTQYTTTGNFPYQLVLD